MISISGDILEEVELLSWNRIGRFKNLTVEGGCELQRNIVKVHPKLVVHSRLKIHRIELRDILLERMACIN